jgi:hypothetical protein
MIESLYRAREELKRADHLIYVSLKYTRTVDVIKSIVERLINCFDFGINSILVEAKEKKQIAAIPTTPKQKCDTLVEIFPNDEKIADFVSFYKLLRKISMAEFTKAQEYRRHVTMTAIVDDSYIDVNIDIIHEYNEKTKDFINYIQTLRGE